MTFCSSHFLHRHLRLGHVEWPRDRDSRQWQSTPPLEVQRRATKSPLKHRRDQSTESRHLGKQQMTERHVINEDFLLAPPYCPVEFNDPETTVLLPAKTTGRAPNLMVRTLTSPQSVLCRIDHSTQTDVELPPISVDGIAQTDVSGQLPPDYYVDRPYRPRSRRQLFEPSYVDAATNTPAVPYGVQFIKPPVDGVTLASLVMIEAVLANVEADHDDLSRYCDCTTCITHLTIIRPPQHGDRRPRPTPPIRFVSLPRCGLQKAAPASVEVLLSYLRADPFVSSVLCGCRSCVSHKLMAQTWRIVLEES